jgi:glycosyltransferase 2 family protein
MLKMICKYAVALGLLVFLTFQIDVSMLWKHIAAIDPLYACAAFALFNASQVMAALRMQYYYALRGLHLSPSFCIKLYYVSLLYNQVVPGGVGGDAYKVYLLNKQHDFSVAEGVRLQLANRTSGLLAICVQLCGIAMVVTEPTLGWWALCVGIAGILITTLCYRIVTRRFLHETAQEAISALPYSLAVQSCALLSAALLWLALGGATQSGEIVDYLLLFLIAAIAGMIPITIGGLGLREMTFYYGASIMGWLFSRHITPELGVSISLSYFALSFFASLIGALWTRSVHAHNLSSLKGMIPSQIPTP